MEKVIAMAGLVMAALGVPKLFLDLVHGRASNEPISYLAGTMNRAYGKIRPFGAGVINPCGKA
jgi:hypothetical protein